MSQCVPDNAYFSAVVVLACIIMVGILVILMLVRDGVNTQVSTEAVEEQEPETLTVPAGERPARVRALFDAIRQVESGGNRDTVGDGGASKGPYQISRAYWYDGCKHGGMNWDYDIWVWNDDYCRQIMVWYWARYGATTDEERMALHVAGPTGIAKMGKSKEIQAYIRRVKQVLTVTMER